MGNANWEPVTGSLSDTDTEQGVTDQQTNMPNGNGTHIYGFHSLSDKDGAAGQYLNGSFFNPASKGVRISGAMIRWPNTQSFTGWSNFLFACLQEENINGECYMLGLHDANPAKIVLRRGLLSEGIKTAVVGEDGVLAVSNDEVYENAWVHLRLDVVVNANNDVRLVVKRNDLSVNTVGEFLWENVDGMAPVFEDAFGISNPSLKPGLKNGYLGFGFEQRELGRAAFFGHIEAARQQ